MDTLRGEINVYFYRARHKAVVHTTAGNQGLKSMGDGFQQLKLNFITKEKYASVGGGAHTVTTRSSK
jgi:hypothetical protein